MTRAALLTVAAIALAACARMPTGEHDGLRYDERRARLSAIESWEMSGRIGVDTPERDFTASFRWVQDRDVSTLRISGPFGAGAIEVTGTPDRMIVTAEGEQRVLTDPEIDLSELLGWWVPVQSLGTWLLGVPDPAHAARTRLGPGSVLRELDQRLWQLDYQTYQLTDGLLVPRRIDMTYDELEVRLAVTRWTVRSLNSTASQQHNTAL